MKRIKEAQQAIEEVVAKYQKEAGLNSAQIAKIEGEKDLLWERLDDLEAKQDSLAQAVNLEIAELLGPFALMINDVDSLKTGDVVKIKSVSMRHDGGVSIGVGATSAGLRWNGSVGREDLISLETKDATRIIRERKIAQLKSWIADIEEEERTNHEQK